MYPEPNPSYELRKYTRWVSSLCTVLGMSVGWATGYGSEQETIPAKPELPTAAESATQNSNTEKNTGIGIEAAFLYPPARPAVTFGYSRSFGQFHLSLRLQGSWVSLAQTFSEAAQQSSYASRLSESKAQLTEINLSVPEVSYYIQNRYFIAVSPIFRATQCTAAYGTVNENTLQFESTGLSLGVQGTTGIRVGGNFKIEFNTGIHLPVSSIGAASVDYTQTSTSPVADFSDDELDSILNSLQPYAKELSEGLTLQFGLRGVWEI